MLVQPYSERLWRQQNSISTNWPQKSAAAEVKMIANYTFLEAFPAGVIQFICKLKHEDQTEYDQAEPHTVTSQWVKLSVRAYWTGHQKLNFESFKMENNLNMDLLIPLGYLLSVCRFVPITYSTVQSLDVLNLQFVWVRLYQVCFLLHFLLLHFRGWLFSKFSRAAILLTF